MKKAFIFDLDGTLANTIYDIGDSINGILSRRGFPPHGYDEYLQFVGKGIGAALSMAMPSYDSLGEDEKAALRKEFSVHNGEHCLDKTKPYPGMMETLEALDGRGIVLGIFTNKPEDIGKKIARELFGGINFRFVFGALEGKPLKPNPERILAELKNFGIAPADTVFIGDAKVDIDTGKNGGMFCCGVLWGFKGKAELEGADVVISKPEELLSM